MSSSSPDDANVETGFPASDRGQPNYLENRDGNPEVFESTGSFESVPEHGGTEPVERRMETKRARTQPMARGRAAESAKARYEQMSSHNDPAAERGRRIGRVEQALAASVVVNQFQELFPRFTTNPFIKSGISWTPLLATMPKHRGNGVGGFAADPRVWSLAAIEGLVAARELSRRVQLDVDDVEITRSVATLAPGSVHRFKAVALDRNQRAIPGESIVWSSSDQKIATVVPDGTVTAVAKGTTTITAATPDGKHSYPVTLTVA
jgi:Bacterial Ig-like domain (group 2)